MDNYQIELSMDFGDKFGVKKLTVSFMQDILEDSIFSEDEFLCNLAEKCIKEFEAEYMKLGLWYNKPFNEYPGMIKIIKALHRETAEKFAKIISEKISIR